MRQKWQPENYHDSYREDLLKRIELKVQAGNTKTLTPAAAKTAEARTADVLDLSELLKRSLAQRGDKPARGASRTRGAASKARANPSTPGPAQRRRRA